MIVHSNSYFILIVLLLVFGSIATAMATEPQAGAIVPGSDGTVKLNDSTVDLAISNYPLLVLDCYVTGCEPCTALSPAVHELAGEFGDRVTFGMIDIEKNPITAKKYNITSYPTLLIFKYGVLIDSQAGYGSKEELSDLIKMDYPGLNSVLAAPHQQQTNPLEPNTTQMTTNTTQMTTLVPIRDMMTAK